MRNKKLLSTVVASALVATTMAVPVMAADGGEVDVDVSTKTAVIRVEVPTSLEIAVNQFEKGDQGSQIYSGAFDIVNKSEIPVKLSVTSTATLNSTKPIGLVSSKEAAENSTAEDGEAWFAVAAKTSATKYTEATGKDVKDLTEADPNVTTFVQDENNKSTAKAEQVYYLAAEAVTPPATELTITYKKVAPTDADELAAAKKISYAQFHELTAITTQPTTDATLQTEVDKADIYAIDGSDVVTFIAKGTAGARFASGSTYYTAGDVVAYDDLAASKIYVYGETANAGGKAGFRYIGKLSDKETWTNADISKVKIAYDIKGVTETKYGEVEDDCTYGLYVDPASLIPEKSSVPATTAIPASGDITVSVTKGQDNADLTKLETSAYAGDMLAMGGGYGATYENGTITLGADVATFLRGASADDLSATTFTATFGTGDDSYTTVFKFTK